MKDSVKKQILGLLSGVFIAYAITCLVFIIYAILLTYTSLTEKNISLVVTITSIVSVFVAGFDAAKVSKCKGLLWGILAGFFYGIILIFLMVLVEKKFFVNSRIIILLVLSLASGGLGGVAGINLKKTKKI